MATKQRTTSTRPQANVINTTSAVAGDGGAQTPAIDVPVTCAITVPHDLMSPAYRKGDVALLAPSRTLRAGHDYIIASLDPRAPTGPDLRRIVHVERITAKEIIACQYNPAKVRRYSRAKWWPVYRITGCYNREALSRAAKRDA